MRASGGGHCLGWLSGATSPGLSVRNPYSRNVAAVLHFLTTTPDIIYHIFTICAMKLSGFALLLAATLASAASWGFEGAALELRSPPDGIVKKAYESSE
jgi:hypothetical protein